MSRYVPDQDEYGRWAVRDTAERDYLFIARHATEDSAQAFADIMNATGSGPRKMDELWAVYDRVRRYAQPIMRSGGWNVSDRSGYDEEWRP